MIVVGYYGFMWDARVSVHPSLCRPYNCPSILYFWRISWVNINGLSPNFWYCAHLVRNCKWANFVKFLQSYLPATHPYFRFLMITSEYQWIFTKHGMYIDIVEIWFGIAKRANFVNFWQNYLPATHPYFHFWTITWVNINEFSPNLVCALILWRSGLELQMGKFRQLLTELSAHHR